MLKKTSLLLLTITLALGTLACGDKSNENSMERNEANPTAVIETSMGTIEAELFADKIPELAKNFIELAKAGRYDDVPFHRVIADFMIQTGDFTNKNGTGGYSYKGPGVDLPGEFADGVSNVRGTLSMANRGPDTNGSQFFINLKDNSFLDHDQLPESSQHPVFGKVVAGLDIVDKIALVDVKGDAPVEEILMTKVTIKE